MFFPGFLAALIIALLVIAILSLLLGYRGPGDRVFWLFLIIFLGAWAIGVWARPVGPLFMGVAWIPFLVGALALALLLLAISETGSRRTLAQPTAETHEEVAATVGIFFWVLILLLIALIVVGALWVEPAPQYIYAALQMSQV